MYNSYSFSSMMTASPFLFLLLVIDLVLRGIALYKSARRDQRIWFIAVLIINSVGILPLIYLLLNGDINLSPATTKKTTAKKSARRSKK